jgi:hypothetical protein
MLWFRFDLKFQDKKVCAFHSILLTLLMPILTSMPRTNFNYLLVTNFNLFLIIYLITTCSCAAQPFIVAGTAAVYIKKQSINSIA